jgi:hypothetical protein
MLNIHVRASEKFVSEIDTTVLVGPHNVATTKQ